jgi:hypothetical protein
VHILPECVRFVPAENYRGIAVTRDGSLSSIAVLMVATVSFADLWQTPTVGETFFTFNILERVKRIVVGQCQVQCSPSKSTSGSILSLQSMWFLRYETKTRSSFVQTARIAVRCKFANCSPLQVKVFRCSEPIDVAVFVPPHVLTTSFDLEPALDGAIFGQGMYF